MARKHQKSCSSPSASTSSSSSRPQKKASCIPLPKKQRQQPERSHEENQERAFIAASRRTDRSIEARVQSARMASTIHKKRTGRGFRISEEIVLKEDMYEEEDDDLTRFRSILGAGKDSDVALQHERDINEQFAQHFPHLANINSLSLQRPRHSSTMAMQQPLPHPPQQQQQQQVQQPLSPHAVVAMAKQGSQQCHPQVYDFHQVQQHQQLPQQQGVFFANVTGPGSEFGDDGSTNSSGYYSTASQQTPGSFVMSNSRPASVAPGSGTSSRHMSFSTQSVTTPDGMHMPQISPVSAIAASMAGLTSTIPASSIPPPPGLSHNSPTPRTTPSISTPEFHSNVAYDSNASTHTAPFTLDGIPPSIGSQAGMDSVFTLSGNASAWQGEAHKTMMQTAVPPGMINTNMLNNANTNFTLMPASQSAVWPVYTQADVVPTTMPMATGFAMHDPVMGLADTGMLTPGGNGLNIAHLQHLHPAVYESRIGTPDGSPGGDEWSQFVQF